MHTDSATRSKAPKTPVDEAAVERLAARIAPLEAAIGEVIVGQKQAVRHLVVTLLAGGHALLEGVPGLAKTLMVRTLAEAVSLSFKRIQFTPDLMPGDILGTDVLEENADTGRRSFQFRPGPIFANLVLADEINRSPPKTQSALLEAMEERAVTWAGETRPLAQPFFVLATQNPIEQAGTYPLPEAQLDRFLLHIGIDYPSAQDEVEIVASTTDDRTPDVPLVLDGDDLIALQHIVRQIHIARPLVEYATRIVRASRPQTSEVALVRDDVAWGAGPRAGQALVLASKALALVEGRFAVTVDDLHQMAVPVLVHRLVIGFRGQAEGTRPDDVVASLLDATPEPTSPLER